MIIGLTGGIGSGKTLASDYFKDRYGFAILDNDVTAREVVDVGSPLLGQIAAHFGEQVLLASGALNRAWLRERIFSHPDDKTWLEGLTHPEIRRRTLTRLAQVSADEVLILVSPLLFESQQDRLCDQTLTLNCPIDVQFARVMARDASSPELIERIMANQLKDEHRAQKATHVVYNDGSLTYLYQQLDALAQQWIRR